MEKEEIDVTFFVPCLNEEKNIQGALKIIFEALRELPHRCEIIAVDDGSTDNTLGALTEMSQDHPPIPIRIVHNQKNRGLGHNYFAMAPLAKGKYYMMVCGDNVTPKETLQTIIRQMGKADMVIPFYAGKDGRNKTRRTLSWLFTKIVNRVSGNHIRYYNGQILQRTENVRDSGLKSTGFGGQAELVCLLLQKGKTFMHVHVSNDDRPFGSSRAFRLSNILSTLGGVFRIFWRRIRL